MCLTKLHVHACSWNSTIHLIRLHIGCQHAHSVKCHTVCCGCKAYWPLSQSVYVHVCVCTQMCTRAVCGGWQSRWGSTAHCVDCQSLATQAMQLQQSTVEVPGRYMYCTSQCSSDREVALTVILRGAQRCYDTACPCGFPGLFLIIDSHWLAFNI